MTPYSVRLRTQNWWAPKPETPFNFRVFWPVGIWTIVILILIGLPGYSLPSFPYLNLLNFDKFVHCCIFFIETVLLVPALLALPKNNPIRIAPLFWSMVTVVFFAGLTEILQSVLFIQRSADIGDFIANTIGVIFASGFCLKSNVSLRKVQH